MCIGCVWVLEKGSLVQQQLGRGEYLLHSTFYIGRSSYNFLKNDQLELLNRKEKLKLCGTYSMRMLVQLYFVGTF